MFCVFCEIAKGAIPSKKIFEDDTILAIHDISPQAPVHAIIFPKAHVAEGANDITEDNAGAIAHIFTKIPEIAGSLGLKSYRIINNCGADAGQSVPHIHFHLLGGVNMGDKLI